MKTIMMTITRGSAARDILRSGVLAELLEHDNLQIVILLNVTIQDYFRREFDHPRIILYEVKNKENSRWRKFFIILFNGLVYTETEHRKLKFGAAFKEPESKPVFYLKHATFSIISRIRVLKYIARWMEEHLFVEKDYDDVFVTFKPDLLFCTSLYARGLDFVLIKAARRFGVPSVSMPKSWDTVGRLFFAAPSNKIILQNNFMKERVIEEQLIPAQDITVCGLPQFDVYGRKKNFMTREEFCLKTGLDKNKPIILYASEGLGTHWDDIYVDDLIVNHKILEKYNFVLRPHFNNLQEKFLHKYKQPGVYIDDEHLRITDMFRDHWDPTLENMEWLAEVIHAADVVVTFVSTFALDVMTQNKPVVNIYYDLKTGPLIIPMKELYNCVHYNAVMAEKSVALARSGAEVIEWIEKYLHDPSLLGAERQKTITKLCYKIDGGASKRITDVLLTMLS